jgi:hypothetical protein
VAHFSKTFDRLHVTQLDDIDLSHIVVELFVQEFLIFLLLYKTLDIHCICLVVFSCCLIFHILAFLVHHLVLFVKLYFFLDRLLYLPDALVSRLYELLLLLHTLLEQIFFLPQFSGNLSSRNFQMEQFSVLVVDFADILFIFDL